MAFKIADIFAALGLDDSEYNRKINQARGTASTFGNVLQGIFQGVGQRLFSGIVNGLESLIGKMGNAVTASSDLTEEINKSGVIFGSAAKDVVAWSETTTESMGVSQRAALQATGQFGALFRQMGDLPAAAAATSENLVQMAADLSSIYNIPIDQALLKLRSGLAGEIEPLRSVNIFMNEHIVANKAVELGLAASTDAVSESAKVHARYALIVEQAAIAQGDQARTVNELAGAQRKLTAETEDGAAKLGNVFRPAITAITNQLVSVAPQMFQYAANIMDQFASGLAAGIRAIIPVVNTLTQIFAYWFKPGSPPRFLPDIAKWGAATMQVYLDSFSSVDVKKAFDTVGSAIESILRSNVAAGKGSEGGLVNAVFGTRDAIRNAVAEFASAGAVSESTINKIVRSAGTAGPSIAALVKAYFNLQTATTAATRAQDDLNRITDEYDAILDPLQGKLDAVRNEQRKLADQQRLISAQNTLANFDSTAAERRSAQLEIQQIQLESQIATVEDQKKAETDKVQAQLDGAKKAEDAAKKQLDAAQATIDNQVQTNNLLAEQRQLEQRLAQEREAEADKQARLAEQLHQAQLQYQLGIANTQTKLALLRGELANTTEGSTEYYSLLGQIASLEKQSAEEAQRNADKVTSAQLDYNLSLADTAGKIAIWQGELAKATPGTAEYFQILTKIHDLNVSLAKEGAKSGLNDIGAGLVASMGQLPTLLNPPGGKSLADSINEAATAVKALFGVKAPADNGWGASIGQLAGKDAIMGPPAPDAGPGEPPAWMKTIIDYIKNTLLPMFDTVSAKLGDLITFFGTEFPKILAPIQQTIDAMVQVIETRFPKIVEDSNTTASGMTKIWQDHGDVLRDYWRLLWSDISIVFTGAVDILSGILRAFVGVFTADWGRWLDGLKLIGEGFWVIFHGLFVNELERIKITFGEFSPDMIGRFTGFFKSIYDGWVGLWDGVGKTLAKATDSIGEKIAGFFASIIEKAFNGGASFIKNMISGITSVELPDFVKKVFGGVTDLLPGSEPKDPTSPLAGLGKRGAALVENFQAGMDKASFNIQPLANSLLPSASTAGAASNDNRTSNSNVTQILNFYGKADPETVRKAAASGLSDVLGQMRSVGMAT